MIKFPMSVLVTAVALGALAGCAPASGPVAVETESTKASPSSTPEPEVSLSSTEPDGTRALPWPAGSQAKYDDTSVWTYSIGATALDQWPAIVTVNEFSEPPAEGNMYITAPVTLTVDTNEQTSAGVDPYSSLQISYVTGSGKSGKECVVQLPAPGDLYEVGLVYGGATVEFLACAEVPVADVSGGTWAVRSLIDQSLVTFFEGTPKQ